MEEKELNNYLKAAAVEREVMEAARGMIKAGAEIAKVVDSIESMIKEKGAAPAFPANLSINDIAAHDTASVEESRTIADNSLVKVDVGTHVDGFIADCAVTVDLSGENGKLIEAAEAALEAAVSVVRADVSTADIGKAVEEVIKQRGFKPIENLTGHALAQYELHAGTEVPNYAARSGVILKEGDVIAIEPFATNGRGYVVESARSEIFSVLTEQPTRNTIAREMFKKLSENYRTLPFAERWVVDLKEPDVPLKRAALRELVRIGALHSYPVLKEKEGGLVAQAEHTVIVEKDAARVLV